MQHYKNWTEIKHKLLAAKRWLCNKDKIDSQDHKPYALVVNLLSKSIQYCGQHTAGADNYHSPDTEFTLYLAKSIKKNFTKISEDAISLMQIDADEKALKAKVEIEGAMGEIKQIEDELHA